MQPSRFVLRRAGEPAAQLLIACQGEQRRGKLLLVARWDHERVFAVAKNVSQLAHLRGDDCAAGGDSRAPHAG